MAARPQRDPAFSVVIPAHDAEDTLAAAIESVLAQTRRDFELFVVDDGSGDATASIASSFARSDPRLRVVTHERSAGPSAARNAAIARGRAPYVSLLDSDDLWLPRYLEVMGDTLEASPDAGFAYTEGWLLDDVSRRILKKPAMARWRPPAPAPHSSEGFLRELIRRPNFVLYAATIRRDALEVAGAFNPTLKHAEDYELWLRILAHGYRAVRAPRPLVVRRDRPTSLSHDELGIARGVAAVMRLAIESHPAPADVKAIARRRLAKVERAAARLEATGRPALPRRIRAALGRIKRRLIGDRLYYPEPPAEVAAAFGDLRRV